ncbi:hypothetical protein K402DRAFT_368779 [Aulographum hederae CBS 113979]|uniref:C3H1-type domain-containing protein n=1 Tax=Aulographum hederae CBS 113979 TaxID=1176131 RepID=A0A6G1HD87_9PEZI|nr:hypothetical protein K402DRAFT_368779 [Aulographum hederae CBS 113979]
MNGTAVHHTNGATVHDIEGHIRSFQESDERRQTLLSSIVIENERLKQQLRVKCADYDNECMARRLWQERYSGVSEEVKQVRREADSSPLVLVLVDGDGVLFEDYLLKAGREGGADAAHRLLQEVRSHVQKQHTDISTSNWSIMVQIYANLDGLAKKLCAVGILSHPVELHAFTRAFSLNQPLFSFIDVGVGKERADHKIKEMFRLFISNHQCKHIIFGGCHDNGYLPNLDSYKLDASVSQRISLLESTPMESGFTMLKYNVLRLPSLFRTESLPDRPTGKPPAIVSSSSFPKVPTPAPTMITAPPTPSPSVSKATLTKTTPPPSVGTPSNRAELGTTTWATVGKAAGSVKNISIASTKHPIRPRPAIFLNAFGQRLDAPLPNPGKASFDSLYGLIKEQKVCNDHHLYGECSAGHKLCQYSHKKLNEGQLVALRHIARKKSCSFLGDCRDVHCYMGHVCPDEDCYFGTSCHFYDTHGIDRTVTTKMYDDGQVEAL